MMMMMMTMMMLMIMIVDDGVVYLNDQYINYPPLLMYDYNVVDYM